MELIGKVQGPFFLCRLKLFDAGLMDMSSWAGRVNVVWRNNPLDKMGVYKRRLAVSRVIFQKCLGSCVSCRKNNQYWVLYSEKERRSDNKHSGLSLNFMTSHQRAEVGLCAARRDPAKSVGTGGSLDVGRRRRSASLCQMEVWMLSHHIFDLQKTTYDTPWYAVLDAYFSV